MNLFLSYIYYKNLLKNYQTNIFILNLKLNIYFTCMFFFFYLIIQIWMQLKYCQGQELRGLVKKTKNKVGPYQFNQWCDLTQNIHKKD